MKVPTKARLAKIAKISIGVEPDPESYVGNCSAVSPEHDRAAEARIRDELADGNEWAWCIITVTAEWGGMFARDTLCGCSYASEEDFRDSLFPDMRDNALEELHETLTSETRARRGAS